MDGKCSIREVAKDVWTFSCSFDRFGIFPVGGRSTAIKLRNGDVWVLASTPLTSETKEKLNELGQVKWIVGANAVHHMHLAAFKREYPDAKLIAPKEVEDKNSAIGLVLDGVWDIDPPSVKYGFANDIQYCFFSGFNNKDAVFFHIASKTLIEADLLFNLPATEQRPSQYSKTRSSGKFPFAKYLNPHSAIHKRFAWYLGTDKAAMKRDVKTVASWNLERIIPCHGDIIEKDADKAWREAYKWYLD